MNDYQRGFEDALDLVNSRLDGRIKTEIQEIINRVRENKIVKLERDLGF